ncbi:MAG: hypothetical protein ABS69_06925 [Nitrosomonadales bacterium SCN 54-20]|nr:MAG: hypothetical protein ABS69_06925 [Nitrosomonadales bacterium SCN 54-20]
MAIFQNENQERGIEKLILSLSSGVIMDSVKEYSGSSGRIAGPRSGTSCNDQSSPSKECGRRYENNRGREEALKYH